MKRLILYLIAIVVAACNSTDDSKNKTENFEISGLDKFNKEDYKSALVDFNKHLELYPNDTSAYFYRAKTKSRLNDIQGAYNDYSKTLAIDPNNIKALNNRALESSSLGNEQAAIDDFTKLINLKPDRLAEVYVSRGGCRNRLNDTIGAMDDFKKSIEIQPKNPNAYVSMAIAHIEINPELALEEVNKALEFDSQYPSAFFVRGSINMNLKNRSAGCDDLSKAVSLGFESAKPYYEKYCVLPANTYLIGKEINFGNYTLTIIDYEEKSYYNSEFQPKSGNKLVAVEVLINNTGQTQIETNVLEFKIIDENSYEYKTVIFGMKKPYLISGVIQSGRKTRGWVTFEVSKQSTKFEVKYTPGLFTGKTDYFIRLNDEIE